MNHNPLYVRASEFFNILIILLLLYLTVDALTFWRQKSFNLALEDPSKTL